MKSNSANSILDLLTLIRKDADQCVLCGMCLPHCPTYGLTRSEAESPRGRISLMLALANDQLEPTQDLRSHLDNCLACRACERMCPSRVPYGRLLTNTRAVLGHEGRRPAGERFMNRLLDGSARRQRAARSAFRLYERSGAQALVRHITPSGGNLRRLDDLLPPLTPATRLPERVPPQGEPRGRVALFTGCTGELFDLPALAATVRLLSALGYAVEIPSAQVCCGARHRSSGQLDRAREQAVANLAAFAEADAVVSISSGCGATLDEYQDWGDGGEAFSGKVYDVSDFLARCEWPGTLRFEPLNETVAVHTPCSLRNVLRREQAPYRLLERIPGLDVVPLAHNETCCGAAGSYMLEHPETADALREPKIAALAQSGARYLVSSNVGCALHLAAGARRAGLEVEVLHPVVLLERQLVPE
jgi:glycolate oxidase iron-sulfur subunit